MCWWNVVEMTLVMNEVSEWVSLLFSFVWGHNNNNQNNRLIVIIPIVMRVAPWCFKMGEGLGVSWTKWRWTPAKPSKSTVLPFQIVTWSDLSYYLGFWIRFITFGICPKKIQLLLQQPSGHMADTWTTSSSPSAQFWGMRAVCTYQMLWERESARITLHTHCVCCAFLALCVWSHLIGCQLRTGRSFVLDFFLVFCSLCIQEFLEIGRCEVKWRANLLWYWALLKNVWYVPIIHC